MKRNFRIIMVFLGLKVVELLAIVFVPYFLGMLVSKWTWFCLLMEFDKMPYWLIGFLSIGIIVIFSCFVVVAKIFLESNWDLAKSIINKKN